MPDVTEEFGLRMGDHPAFQTRVYGARLTSEQKVDILLGESLHMAATALRNRWETSCEPEFS